VTVRPSDEVDPPGLVTKRLIVPAVMVCLAFAESVKVAVAPAPMRAKDATPNAPTVRSLRERAMEVFFRSECGR